MNIAEAARINTVLGDTLEGLAMLKVVTPEVLSEADSLGGVVGDDVASRLVQHRAALEAADGNVADDVLCDSAMALYRALRDSDGAVEALAARSQAPPPVAQAPPASVEESIAAVQRADTEASAMDGVLTYFAQLKAIVQRKLATTVEEEASMRAHFEEVRHREEKAGKEREALEQQLRLERKEREKQLAQANEREARAEYELEALRTSTDHRMKVLHEEATRQRESDKASFEEREAALLKEVEMLTKELEELSKSNRDEEAVLRKRKNKAEQEVATWIELYDKDMGSREKAYQEERAVYEEVQKSLKEYKEHYEQLRLEAEEAAAEVRRKQQAAEEEAKKQQALDEAATKIQGMWKTHKANKEAEAAAAKKKKGKKKK